jgi:hypothetical protein
MNLEATVVPVAVLLFTTILMVIARWLRKKPPAKEPKPPKHQPDFIIRNPRPFSPPECRDEPKHQYVPWFERKNLTQRPTLFVSPPIKFDGLQPQREPWRKPHTRESENHHQPYLPGRFARGRCP